MIKQTKATVQSRYVDQQHKSTTIRHKSSIWKKQNVQRTLIEPLIFSLFTSHFKIQS